MIRVVRRVLVGLAVAVTACYAEAQSAQGLAEAAGRGLLGTAAPALVVETIDGASIDLGQLYGKKAVYLKFWATWCGPCMQQMPHFEHAYETAGPDLAVIAVNTGFNDSLPDVRAVVRDKGLKMPVVIDDGRLAAALHLRVTPQHVVIGRDGRIAYVGHLADERLDNELRAAQAPVRERPSTHGTEPAAIARFGVGDRLPDLSAETLDGDTFHARGDERRPTVLVFLSPWCESYLAKSRPTYSTSCREVREQVAALGGADTGVRWLGVASGLWATMDELRKYDTDLAPAIPLTLDEGGDWFRAFDVTQVPTIVIADAGRIVKRIEGFDARLPDEINRIRAH